MQRAAFKKVSASEEQRAATSHSASVGSRSFAQRANASAS